MSAPVDVLRELDLISAYFANRDEGDCVARMVPLRAAVADLIEAAERYQEAQNGHTSLVDRVRAGRRLLAAISDAKESA